MGKLLDIFNKAKFYLNEANKPTDNDPMGLYTSKETDQNTPLVKPSTYGMSKGELYRMSSGVPAGGRVWNDQTNMVESHIANDPTFTTVASVLGRGKYSGQQLINAFYEDAKEYLGTRQGSFSEKELANTAFNMMRNSGYGSAADNPTKVYDFTAPTQPQEVPRREQFANRVAYRDRTQL